MKVYVLYSGEIGDSIKNYKTNVYDTKEAARKAFEKKLKKLYDDGYDEEDRTFDECVKQMDFSMTYEDEPYIELFVKEYSVKE